MTSNYNRLGPILDCGVFPAIGVKPRVQGLMAIQFAPPPPLFQFPTIHLCCKASSGSCGEWMECARWIFSPAFCLKSCNVPNYRNPGRNPGSDDVQERYHRAVQGPPHPLAFE